MNQSQWLSFGSSIFWVSPSLIIQYFAKYSMEDKGKENRLTRVKSLKCPSVKQSTHQTRRHSPAALFQKNYVDDLYPRMPPGDLWQHVCDLHMLTFDRRHSSYSDVLVFFCNEKLLISYTRQIFSTWTRYEVAY